MRRVVITGQGTIHALGADVAATKRAMAEGRCGIGELEMRDLDRLAVRTYVMEWDDMVMREALLREHHRGGQSFIVVPRISDMAEVEEWLREHVPEVKVVTALSEVAQKRLKVLGDLDSLGAGFQLASHDLDIRGAGNLLGDEQSGHIREVGFELYQSMLEDAILAARAGDAGLESDRSGLSPQITVDAPIMIPEDYVPDLAVRMALYRRLNDARDKAEIESLAAEMIDRFGELPQPTKNLVRLIEIKQQAIDACIAKIDVGARGTLVTFHEDNFPEPAGLIDYVARLEGTAKLRPDMKLVINRAWGDPRSRLNGLFQLTRGLSRIVKKAQKKNAA